MSFNAAGLPPFQWKQAPQVDLQGTTETSQKMEEDGDGEILVLATPEEEEFVEGTPQENETPIGEVEDVTEMSTQEDPNEDLEFDLIAACIQKEEETITQLLKKGAMVSRGSDYVKELFFHACRHGIDKAIVRLINLNADINATDEQKKIPFDYYLEAGGNLGNLLLTLNEDKRNSLIYGYLDVQEEVYINPGELMILLADSQFREKLLTHPTLEFLTGNVLKVYAQICEIVPEPPKIVEVLNKISLDTQIEFMGYLNDPELKESLITNYLKAHPELTDKELEDKQIELTEIIEKRKNVLTNLKDIEPSKEQVLGLTRKIGRFNSSAMQLQQMIKRHKFWNPTEKVTELSNYLKQQLEESEAIRKSIEQTYPSLVSTGFCRNKENVENPKQVGIQQMILYQELIKLSGDKNIVRRTKFDPIYHMIFADFKDQISCNDIESFKQKVKEHIQLKFKELNISTFQRIEELSKKRKRTSSEIKEAKENKNKTKRLKPDPKPLSPKNI